jgi:prepilin peptidase CpaA
MNPLVIIGLLACVGLAAGIDVCQRRIPNWLSLSGVVGGICLNSIFEGRDGFVLSLLGIATGFFLLFFGYLLGGIGAGDVKLLAAVGAFLGPKLVFCAFIWMALSGGFLALLFVAWKGAFRQTFVNLKSLLQGWMYGTGSSIDLKNPSLLKLPRALSIALGAIVAAFFQKVPGLGFQNGSVHVIFWTL